jgi:hypothetical protein
VVVGRAVVVVVADEVVVVVGRVVVVVGAVVVVVEAVVVVVTVAYVKVPVTELCPRAPSAVIATSPLPAGTTTVACVAVSESTVAGDPPNRKAAFSSPSPLSTTACPAAPP